MTSDLKPRTRAKKTANFKLYLVSACAILFLYVFFFSKSEVLSPAKLESAASAITKGISGTPRERLKTVAPAAANAASAVDKKTHELVHELKKQAEGDPVSEGFARGGSDDSDDAISSSRESYLTALHEPVAGKNVQVSAVKTTEKQAGRSGGHAYDAADALQVLCESYEMIVFSKTYCPHSKRAKAILGFYDIRPRPLVFELDVEAHGAELQAALAELTGRRTVPNVMVHGESLGGGDELANLDKADTLVTKIRALSDRIDITRKARRAD